jgi:hypothetical protein
VDGHGGDQRPGDTSISRPSSDDGVRTIHDGDRTIAPPLDAVLEVLRDGPLCVACIARAANITALRVLSALAEIGLQAAIIEEVQPCNGCGILGETHATLAAATAAADLSGIATLVVDDHEDTMDLYAGVLEEAGAIAQRATNLLEALNLLQQVKIDIVVTDIAVGRCEGCLREKIVHEVA